MSGKAQFVGDSTSIQTTAVDDGLTSIGASYSVKNRRV